MARRRSTSAPRVNRSAPAPAPARSTAVAAKPAAQVAPQPAVQGQSMLASIATTAAGVAIGHTAGHMLTGAFTGGNHDAPVETAAPAVSAAQAPMAQSQQNVCQNEMQQFLNCSQQQADLSLCEGFNQILKECRFRYSNPSSF
jgi:hypothetical protein